VLNLQASALNHMLTGIGWGFLVF